MKMLEDYGELPRKSTCWTSIEMCVCSVERDVPDRVVRDVLWVAVIITITAAAAAEASSCLAWPSLFQHFTQKPGAALPFSEPRKEAL